MNNSLRGLFSGAFLLLNLFLHAQLQINQNNQEYVINFEETIPGVISGQLQGLGFSANPAEGQLNSNAWSVKGLAGGDMDFGGEGTTGSFAMGMVDAGVDTGGIYTHPANGSSAKLMFQPNDDDLTPGSIILKIQNNTGRHVDYLHTNFTYYKYNDQDMATRIAYSVSDDEMLSWNDIWNNTTNQAAQTNPSMSYMNPKHFIPVSINNGDFVYLRWYMEDVSGTGDRDELFLDDIKIRMMDTDGYCIPQFGSTSAGAGITYFSLTNVENTSDIDEIAYSDFTPMVINVVAGDSYDLKFRTGSGFGSRSPKAGVYADFDQSGDFTGPNNDLFGSYSFSGTSAQTVSITIPVDAEPGDTRLRIVVVRDSYNALGPCVNGLWGEAEDYTLRIYPPGSCFSPSGLSLDVHYPDLGIMEWTPGGNESGWNLEAGITGFEPGTGNETVATSHTSPTFNIFSGLEKGSLYDVYVQSDCGSNTSSWVGPVTFYTPLIGFTSEIVEDFSAEEDQSFLSIPDGDWQIVGDHIQSNSEGSLLVSPPIDISENYIIRWDASNDSESAQNTYRLWLTNEGFIHPDNFNVFLGEFTSSSDSWEEVTVDLSAYQGERIFLAFEHISTDAGAVPLRIDNIAVVPLFCVAVSDISVTNITAHQADISWTPGDTEEEWILELGPEGFTPGNGEEDVSENVFSDTEVTVTGLNDNTFYSLYIQSRCGYSGESIWMGPYDFTTLCGIVSPEYTANFTGNEIPDCWWKGKSSQAAPSYIQNQFSAWFFANDAAFVNYTDQRNDYLISKAIDLGDGSVQYQLEFDVRMRSVYSEIPDQFESGESFEVRMSDDVDYQDGQNVFFSESNSVLLRDIDNPIGWEWEHVVIDLSA
ncbi:MAG: GEVED domain-containing protein, partial [Bacteroidales bacterium]